MCVCVGIQMVIYTWVNGSRVRDGGLVEWRRPHGGTLSTLEPGKLTAEMAMESMKTR